jgi:EpsI family protein
MKNRIRFIAASLILSSCVLLVYTDILTTSDVPHISEHKFPARIGSWTGHDVAYDKAMLLRELSPDKIVYKSYDDGHFGTAITLFMAYYNTLEKADFSHSPIVCFTGQGWHIEKVTKKVILIELPNTHEITVNQMIQNRIDTRMITLFWYQTANHTLANRGIQKLSLFFDKMLGKQDNNAFVRLSLIVPYGKSVEETTPHLVRFVRDLYPDLIKLFAT